jgi:hypothetical protein
MEVTAYRCPCCLSYHLTYVDKGNMRCLECDVVKPSDEFVYVRFTVGSVIRQ